MLKVWTVFPVSAPGSHRSMVWLRIFPPSDDNLDYFFKQLKLKGGEELISTYGDMDEQSILVKEFIKKGYLFTMFPSIISHNIKKIWD